MPALYTVFLAADAARLLYGLPRKDRELIRRFLEFLETYPTTEGEFQERDALGRPVEVKLIGQAKIVYWADHARNEIKVLRIDWLG